MREILFRGKAINRDRGYHRTNYKNGDWVYGLITRLYDERFENLPAEMSDFGASGIEIDYKTIGQYAGLTDKNGKKIFEGDIVKLHLIDYTEMGVIKYNDIMCRFMFFTKDGSYSFDNTNDFEVIGNIHDNPELLKGGAE